MPAVPIQREGTPKWERVMSRSSIMGWRGALAFVVVLGATAVSSAARAAQNLNCGAYATKAVEQQNQNILLNCGLTGIGWSADFQAHFNWCRLDQVTMAHVTEADRFRADAITQCAAKPAQDQQACQAYAQEAVAQQKGNKNRGCALKGATWSEDYAAHFNWCLKADQGARNAAQNARNQQLSGCLAAKKAEGGRPRCTSKSDCGAYLCNEKDGLCFTSCRATSYYCAPNYVCDQPKARCIPANR